MRVSSNRLLALEVGATALAMLVLAAATASAATGPTMLTVTYWEDGREPATRITWTLRCNPTGGTHPRRTAACRTIQRGGPALFAPTPKDTACAELYGGPQTALVRGRVSGRRIWARFHRADGCGIDRWQRVAPLVPTAFTG